MIYVLPVAIVAVFILGLIKKVPLYDSFVAGVKNAFPLVKDIFPYVATVLIMCEIFEQSGLSMLFIDLSAHFFKLFGIEKELVPLIMIKPFSGSGSLALLNKIFAENGADSYIGRCAAVIFGSSETVFYVGAVYFSATKKSKLIAPVIISLVSTFFSTVVAVLVCRIM